MFRKVLAVVFGMVMVIGTVGGTFVLSSGPPSADDAPTQMSPETPTDELDDVDPHIADYNTSVDQRMCTKAVDLQVAVESPDTENATWYYRLTVNNDTRINKLEVSQSGEVTVFNTQYVVSSDETLSGNVTDEVELTLLDKYGNELDSVSTTVTREPVPPIQCTEPEGNVSDLPP